MVTSRNWSYDIAGQVTGSRVAGGPQTTYAYDALGRLSQLVEPVSSGFSISTSFSYDASGNRTRLTDGNGHATLTSNNAWDLSESQLEPSTAARPNLSDRTWTRTDDAVRAIK